MKRFLKRLGLLVIAAFVVAQFFRSERTNPAVDPSQSVHARMAVTPAAAAVLNRACRDCHTGETRWPWYSHVAPVNWFVVGHVDHARSHMNLSEWAGLEPKEAAHTLEEMCDEVLKRKMPLPSYLWIHRDAALSDADIEALCAWTKGAAAQMQAEVGTAGPR